MQIVYVCRAALLALLLCLLGACAPNRPAPIPAASLQTANVTAVLPEVLAEPQQWSGRELTLISPVYDDGENRLLAVPLPVSADSVDQTKGIWLAEPLSAEVQQKLSVENTIVKLHGVLSPPGAYGREQQFAYQFVAEQSHVLTPERTTIANLALNPQALDQILLRLEGTLLADPDAALLVDEVGAGGVPKANGHQIKLVRTALSPTLVDSLSGSANVRWGKVEIVGWWQNGTLTPLMVNVPDSTDAVEPVATLTPSAAP